MLRYEIYLSKSIFLLSKNNSKFKYSKTVYNYFYFTRVNMLQYINFIYGKTEKKTNNRCTRKKLHINKFCEYICAYRMFIQQIMKYLGNRLKMKK